MRVQVYLVEQVGWKKKCMRKRKIRKQFWFTEDEANLLKKKAVLVGITESSLIRSWIRDNQLKEKPPPEFYDLINEINRIGNNINQIAHVANMTGKIDVYRHEDNIKDLKKIIKLIKEKYL